MSDGSTGARIFALAERLWPLNRSISGDGLRETLRIIRELLPDLQLIEIPSGERVLDWTVPEEWRIRSAVLDGPKGERIADFATNNLHVVGYSTAIDVELDLAALQPHLHSIPELPDAIPYVTSYYQRAWGFCIPQTVRDGLKPGHYRAHIDAEHFAGSITLGELRIPGRSTSEVLLSTYCCHPSMANNELSGPCLAAHLADWLQQAPRRYSYRILFVPEMIGSIAYLDRHLDELKARVFAGFIISCVGDERAWSCLPSRAGNTLSDRIAVHVLKHSVDRFRSYGWNDRGSDESNYCAPGIDLPIASVMRSKYREYPEYHTSLDRLGDVVTAKGLDESFAVYQRMIEAIEADCIPEIRVLGEPQLGRRGLYPSLSTRDSTTQVRRMLDVISQCDGVNSLLDIAELCDAPIWEVDSIVRRLAEEGIVGLPDRIPVP